MNITENLTPVNHDSGRAGNAVTGIVLHTMVGSTGSAQSRFFNGAAQVSANYGVSLDGSILRWVRESDTAYCNGNYHSNLTTISIEHEDNGDYNGPRTPELYSASSELVADICRRYSIPCDRGHIKGHNEVIDTRYYPGGTDCPDALDLNRIIDGANALLNPVTPVINQPTPSATGETVFLPGDNPTWRLYPTDALPVVGNEKAVLAPAQFGGLTYDVLGHPYSNVVTISTQMFGIGNIWVGPDTNAVIKAAPVQPPVGASINTASEDKAPATAKSVYTRFDSPMNLKANKQPTNVYNLDAGSWSTLGNAIVKQLNQGDPVIAVGKAKHPLGGVYYMTAYSLGNGDVNSPNFKPAHNNGINSVDLTLDVPAPIVEATTPPITITDNTVTPPVVTPAVSTPVENTPTPVDQPAGETIPVKVIPVNPEAWKASFKTNFAGDYIAAKSAVIKDLDGNAEDTQLIEGKTVPVAGTFFRDGKEYALTVKSWNNGVNPTWRAIPKNLLTEDDSIFDISVIDEAKQAVKNLKTEKNIKKIVTLENKLVSYFKHKK